MHSVKKAAKPVKSSSNKLPVAKVAEMPQPETAKQANFEANERRWKVEEALRDIERAEKHKADKLLMKDVAKMAKEKIKALGKIC